MTNLMLKDMRNVKARLTDDGKVIWEGMLPEHFQVNSDYYDEDPGLVQQVMIELATEAKSQIDSGVSSNVWLEIEPFTA